EHPGVARRRPDEPEQHSHDRRLAGPVGPDETSHGACRHGERPRVDGRSRSEPFAQALGHDGWGGQVARSVVRSHVLDDAGKAVARRRPSVEMWQAPRTSDVEASRGDAARETSLVSAPHQSGMIRPAYQRPPWHQVLRRTTAITVLTAFALWLLAAVLPGF